MSETRNHQIRDSVDSDNESIELVPGELDLQRAPLIAAQFMPLILILISTLFTWTFVQIFKRYEAIQPIIFGVLCVATLLRQAWVVYSALFFAVWYRLVIAGVQSIRVQGEDVIFVGTVMLYLIFSLRYIDLGTVYDSAARKSRLSKLSSNAPFTESRSYGNWLSLKPIRSGLISVVIALIAAMLLLIIYPYDWTVDQRLSITPSGMRCISILWFLAIAWFCIDLFFQFRLRHQMDKLAATVHLRSAMAHAVRREFHGIEKRRAKALKSNRKKNPK